MPSRSETAVLKRGRGAIAMEPAASRRGDLVLKGPLKAALGDTVPARLMPGRGEQMRVSARLGRNAPPGLHAAKLRAGDKEIDVTIEIPQREKLRFRPSSIDIAAKPGGKAGGVTLILENRGNVEVAAPATAVAGLFASDGLAGAFASAYAVDSDDPMQIFGQFILTLRRSFLGLMHLKLSGVEEPIAPGETRAVTAEFKIPKPQNEETQVGKGRRFHATFVLGGPRLVARLTIA